MSSITAQVGRVVGGRYRLLAPIGSGASSQVFAAVDTRLGRRVAVKVLHPALESDQTFLRLFRQEARLAASLDHPNVMRVFDWGEEEAGPYLVLELLTGGSLRRLLDAGGVLSHAQVASIGRQAAAGLAYAHRRGIIHRDIKPGNILFDEDGNLRIGDFGVARAIASAAATEPSGTVFGTARYASPEQATGATLDDRTDVYSLALVLYEARTGRVPFAAETVAATLAARVGATLPPAPELGPLAPILAAAAIPGPLARLEAADLAAELEQLERTLPPAAGLPVALLELGPQLATIADRDPTQLDPGHPSAAPTERVDHDETALAPPTGAERGRGERAAGKKPGRRRLLVAVVAVSVAALLAAGVAAVVRFEVYGHVVPSVVRDQLDTARAVLKNEGLRLRVEAERYSSKVPRGVVMSQSLAPGTREKAGSVLGVVVSKGPAPVAIPSVVGEPLAVAERQLRSAGLVPVVAHAYSEHTPAGAVARQSPLSSHPKVLPGSKVTLYDSLGLPPRSVPYVVGQSLGAAEQALAHSQLKYKLGPAQYSTRYAAGEVISETPAPNSSVRQGAVVTLVASLGPPYVRVPQLQGDSVSSAEAALRSRGLSYAVYGPPFASTVYASAPGSGSRVRVGSTVDLYVI